MLDDDLLIAARAKRDQARKRVMTCRQAVEDAEDELRAAEQAVQMIGQIKREHDGFNAEAARHL
jgi:hypothetical protein